MKKYWFKAVQVGFLNIYFGVLPIAWQGWATWVTFGALYFLGVDVVHQTGSPFEFTDSSGFFALVPECILIFFFLLITFIKTEPTKNPISYTSWLDVSRNVKNDSKKE